MRVRHYAQGKFYTIACPEGTRIVRAIDQADGDAAPQDHLVVPLNGKEMRIPADPPELLPLLAETGHFGVSLDGEPEPEHRLAGATCPGCGQDDVNWLQLRAGVEAVHCDRCGTDFESLLRSITSVPFSALDGCRSSSPVSADILSLVGQAAAR
jgi:hypothetical protein